MSYTPLGDFGQQGLFDITRILLQQPDLAALSETLTRLVQQSALADRAAIILWNAGNHRAARYGCDEAGLPVSYEDETVLAHGPVRRLLSRPDALHCDKATFVEAWPQLASSGLYPPFGYYGLLPLAAEGRIFGGGRPHLWRRKAASLAAASLSATTPDRGPRKSSSGCIPLPSWLRW